LGLKFQNPKKLLKYGGDEFYRGRASVILSFITAIAGIKDKDFLQASISINPRIAKTGSW